MAVSADVVEALRAKFDTLLPHLDERQQRLLLGAEARSLGHGGIAAVASASGASRSRISQGASELEAGPEPLGRARKVGGGRKSLTETDPELVGALLARVEPTRRGDPESPLSWTTLSTRKLAEELTAAGHKVGPDTVARLLREQGFSLQGNSSAALLAGVAADDVCALSEPDFVARFEFLDLPALMAAAGAHTYPELQARFPQLFKLHYADPPVYDPDDPAVLRTYRLRVSTLFFPTLDLVEALRRLTRTRRALDAAEPTRAEYEGGAVLGASAWLAVFPDDAIGAGTPTRAQIEALFGADNVVAAFETV